MVLHGQCINWVGAEYLIALQQIISHSLRTIVDHVIFIKDGIFMPNVVPHCVQTQQPTMAGRSERG